MPIIDYTLPYIFPLHLPTTDGLAAAEGGNGGLDAFYSNPYHQTSGEDGDNNISIDPNHSHGDRVNVLYQSVVQSAALSSITSGDGSLHGKTYGKTYKMSVAALQMTPMLNPDSSKRSRMARRALANQRLFNEAMSVSQDSVSLQRGGGGRVDEIHDPKRPKDSNNNNNNNNNNHNHNNNSNNNHSNDAQQIRSELMKAHARTAFGHTTPPQCMDDADDRKIMNSMYPSYSPRIAGDGGKLTTGTNLYPLDDDAIKAKSHKQVIVAGAGAGAGAGPAVAGTAIAVYDEDEDDGVFIDDDDDDEEEEEDEDESLEVELMLARLHAQKDNGSAHSKELKNGNGTFALKIPTPFHSAPL